MGVAMTSGGCTSDFLSTLAVKLLTAPLPVAHKTALAGFDPRLARDRLYVRRWRQSPCILK